MLQVKTVLNQTGDVLHQVGVSPVQLQQDDASVRLLQANIKDSNRDDEI